MFSWSSSAFSMTGDADSLVYGLSAFLKSILYILKFLVHVLLKPALKDFEHNSVNT